MSLPSPVGTDECALALRWELSPTLAGMLVKLNQLFEQNVRRELGLQWPGFYIVSGYRSPRHNREVGGAPTSLHTRCPSLAADLRMGAIAGQDSLQLWARAGHLWQQLGGRWGGVFQPSDPNHFDLGGGF